MRYFNPIKRPLLYNVGLVGSFSQLATAFGVVGGLRHVKHSRSRGQRFREY